MITFENALLLSVFDCTCVRVWVNTRKNYAWVYSCVCPSDYRPTVHTTQRNIIIMLFYFHERCEASL